MTSSWVATPDAAVVSDVVIVGSGVGGLSAALRARGRRIAVLDKAGYGSGGSSVLAQGGMAVAVGSDDSPERHARDTLDAGCGLCDHDVVRSVTAEGPRRLAELMTLGAAFDRDSVGRLQLGMEAAHTRRRIVHAAGDATGGELMRALAREVEDLANVRIFEHTLALSLVTADDRVLGVLAVDRDGRIVLHVAAAVVIATGGIGGVFRHSTNPAGSTGDGLAMAAAAGARLAGLEFVQFHPTALDVGTRPLPLLTEALRGEGAILVDERGDRFMLPVHELGELAPRDVVARGIWRHRQSGHRTLLDAGSLGGRLGDRFPTVVELCRSHGFDPLREPVPVTPAAHYHMGGVVVDHTGRSSVDGLWACGEVSHTGLHGANRLASNSLLEALVYGSRIGERLARTPHAVPSERRAREALAAAPVEVADSPWLEEDGRGPAQRVRELMWTRVGVERSEAGLSRAVDELDELRSSSPGRSELANLILVSSLVARAARARTESRGAHFRVDIPWPDRHWRQPLLVDRGGLMEPRPVAAVG